MAETVAPPTTPEEASESLRVATAAAAGTGKRFSHVIFPGIAVLSVALAAAAFVVNITVLALFGEQYGFIAVDFLGVSWGKLALAVVAHALLIYVVFIYGRIAFKDSFIAPMVVAMGYPGVTVAYADPSELVGAVCMFGAFCAGVLDKHLISALFGVVATFFTPFAWALWIMYAMFILQKKFKSWAWLGIITLFTPALPHAETHRLISEGLFGNISPLGLFLIITTIVWLCSRKGMWPPGFVLFALVLWKMWGGYTVALSSLFVWLPLALVTKRNMRPLPFLLVCLVWVFFSAWVSAHGLVQGLAG